MRRSWLVLRRPAGWLTVLWVLVMIAVPIVGWLGGAPALRWAVTAGVVAQAAAVVAVLQDAWGYRRTLALAALVLPLTWAIEWIGSSTGFPFGSYQYTALLQPQVRGVPLLIPPAWLMMLPPAWAVGVAMTGGAGADAPHNRLGTANRLAAVILLSALAFTAWDLFLDPQMVGWGYWVWTEPGVYFGIPLVNFAGWFAAAALVSVISATTVGLHGLPVWPLLGIYTITWALQSVGQLVFWRMPGPALVGALGMGLFVVGAWRATRNH